ncbi:MAG TPA: ParB/RepB/Spo0J family partition protein [Candidatus Omnitrophota bacterium]|nr:ParB/RepB/Spo0J family partition protein [Candidatus Omnitrophota bacterium]HPD84586.1 ParB/RepB/Spo0J family partition protein [Candidatus Omnitrophota bacterium]HRZ03444.1 ParB/RepB/Spo0J family partition protein [Candidatus Omnitrophota bacterium]
MENRALGKGLSALIPEKVSVDRHESVTYVRIADLKENSLQPRLDFDSEKLSELIASIKEKGVLQPILVRKKGEGYEVIAGERRLRAARSLKMEEVPVVVKTVNDQEALVLALVENIQREELNAIEEAKAFKRLIEEFNFTQDYVAQSVGKERTTVANILRLLKLPAEMQKCISNGTLSVGHGRALLSIENESLQKKLFSKTIKKGLSVRELENLVNASSGRGAKRRKEGASAGKDIYLASLEEDLQKALGTKVRIEAKQKRGRIVIEYYSNEDLDRIAGIIKK